MSLAVEKYFAAVLSGTIKQFLSHGRIGHLFRSETDQALFKFVDNHVRSYGKLPDLSTVMTHHKVALPANVEETAEYYLDVLKAGHAEFGIRAIGKQIDPLLTGEHKQPLLALDKMRDGVLALTAEQNAPYVIDYRDATDLLWTALIDAVKGGTELGLKFGWPTLDNMAGGIEEGDLVSLAGRPGQGKTWLMLWSAFSLWRQGRTILFISMEMKPKPVLQRLSALHAKVPASGLKIGYLTSEAKSDYKTTLGLLPDMPHGFWVVDGNLKAMVTDIQALAMQLQPGVIFIDGAYLLKHPYERDRYRRVAENTDKIKQDLAPLAPVICSWQFSREAKKLKKGEQPTIDHIGYADAIGQHSSLVLGLFEDESIETLTRRKVTVLKGRNGEFGEFNVNWRFDQTTDFSEAKEEKLEELQFL